MDWADSPEQATFRSQVREVMEQGLPDYYKRIAQGDDDEEGGGGGWQPTASPTTRSASEAAQDWATRARRAAAGSRRTGRRSTAAPGLTPMEQFIFNQEMAQRRRAGASAGRASSLLGPTLIVHGTEEQKQEHLPQILARRGRLGAGLLRAGRRLRPRVAPDARGPRRRRVRDQRPEDLDLRRAPRRLALRARAHRPGRAEAPRHLVPADGHQARRASPSAR